MRWVIRCTLLGVLVYLMAWAYRIYDRKYYIWLPDYLRQAAARSEAARPPIHIFFYYTDHFEPGEHLDRIRRWEAGYTKLADRHRDRGGRRLQHSWFYPGEQPIDENMKALRRLVAAGYGEVELHYHHHNDNSESARRKFQDAIRYFQTFGFLKTQDGQTRFGFIHGNWGLDNSAGNEMCGVNDELRILRDLGCFADFTFPSLWNNAQPSMVNTIFEATDDERPKSYDRGVRLRAGSEVRGDLTLMEGPLVIAPVFDPKRLFFVVEDGDIHPAVPATPQRVDYWVRANVHVQGKPEWVFVKVHGHAASSDADMEETLGTQLDGALSYLERRYNDGVNYVLHYVTAREAYNLARAAAAGRSGDPEQYLNFLINPYMADISREHSR